MALGFVTVLCMTLAAACFAGCDVHKETKTQIQESARTPSRLSVPAVSSARTDGDLRSEASEQKIEALNECDFGRFKTFHVAKKREVFRRCTSEQQVELYLRWTGYARHGNTELAAAFASLGRQVLPAVLARMERAGGLAEDGDRILLLEALTYTQNLGGYNVAGDEELVRRLKSAVSLSSHPQTKKSCEMVLDEILHPEFPFRKNENIRSDELDIVAIPADAPLREAPDTKPSKRSSRGPASE